MKCPYLQEAEVKYCGHSMLRKLIVRKHLNPPVERCATAEFTKCALVTEPVEEPGASCCPYLRQSLVQYCSAAPRPQYVPYSEELLSRCGRDAHRYCDAYLAIAKPEGPDTPHVEGMAVPEGLFYSANHMWLETSEDGLCHVGIDAMLSRVLGEVERIDFLTASGEQRPAAVLTAGGVDVQMLFPNPIRITATNTYLRANPSRLGADPYRKGWLFEGVAAADNPASARSGLLAGGEAATEWMAGEVDRLSRFVHDLMLENPTEPALMADGGCFGHDVLTHLNRGQRMSLIHAFFSPSVSWSGATKR